MKLLKIAYEDSFLSPEEIRPYSYLPQVTESLYLEGTLLDFANYLRTDVFPEFTSIKAHLSLKKKMVFQGL